MAPDKSTRTTETNPQQQSTTPSTTDTRQQAGERQRSIETGREPSRSSTLSRRQATSPVYGAGASPFTLMRRMADDMDRIFQDFGFGPTGLGSSSGFGAVPDLWRDISSLEQTAWAPQIETFRRGDKLVVRADLPGLNRDDVKVEVENGILSISGQRSEEREETRDDFYRSERSYGRFYRSLPLPEGTTGDQAEATFKDGVLEVTLPAPIQPERNARQIPIR